MPPAAAGQAVKRPLSGLQKEVLRLYKRSLALIRSKPPASQPAFRLMVRHAFRHPPLSARDVSAVEHALRVGQRRVEVLEGSGVKRVAVSREMEQWWKSQRWMGNGAAAAERASPPAEGGDAQRPVA